jgi:hypothetical protein
MEVSSKVRFIPAPPEAQRFASGKQEKQSNQLSNRSSPDGLSRTRAYRASGPRSCLEIGLNLL